MFSSSPTPIYLDNNATTFLDPQVAMVIAEISQRPLANPASQHALGRAARKVIEDARNELLKAVGANCQGMMADKLIFTSGGTEANNLAILGIPDSVEGSILISSIEHPSVLAAAEIAEQRARRVEFIPCLSNGQIDTSWLQHRLLQSSNQAVASVVLMAANNETGVLQPIQEVGRMCHNAAVALHIDAVQTFGKSPTNFRHWQASSMTICAHKLHGPVGIGALIHRAGHALIPQVVGGFQQESMRGGTESVVQAVAFAEAAKLASEDQNRYDKMLRLRQRFESQLIDGASQNNIALEIIGSQSPRLPNTTCVAFIGLKRQALQMAFDFSGIACSTGSACQSGSATPSHVLQAMRLPNSVVESAIRFSLSARNTDYEVDEACKRILICVQRLAAL